MQLRRRTRPPAGLAWTAIAPQPEPSREVGEALLKEGRLLEAIDVLSAVNRNERDHAVETRLVELRQEASSELDGTGPRRWPPRVKDAFANSTNPPEVAAAELTPELLRSGILRHGSLVVRNLVGEERVRQLVDDIDRAMAAYDAHVGGAVASETAPWFVPFQPKEGTVGREWLRKGGGVLAVDSPPALFDVIETFEEAGIRELVTSYLGERPMLLANKWTLRRCPAGLGTADWHQDGSFMGRDIRSMNVWVALSECGKDSPGLDIVGRRFNDIVTTGTDGAMLDWTVGPGMVERVAKGRVVRPDFEPGDALIFDHLLLHRTGIHPGMTKDRYAIEAWFAAPSSYPPDQMPIAY
jgi:hypothetical protein